MKTILLVLSILASTFAHAQAAHFSLRPIREALFQGYLEQDPSWWSEVEFGGDQFLDEIFLGSPANEQSDQIGISYDYDAFGAFQQIGFRLDINVNKMATFTVTDHMTQEVFELRSNLQGSLNLANQDVIFGGYAGGGDSGGVTLWNIRVTSNGEVRTLVDQYTSAWDGPPTALTAIQIQNASLPLAVTFFVESTHDFEPSEFLRFAGVYGVNNQVPEPGSALLGIMGGSVILLRRKR